MATQIVSRVEKNAPLGVVRRSPLFRPWLWLALGAGFALLANGKDTVALAAWLAPVFLLRFSRTMKAWTGFPVLYLVLPAVFAFQFRGMVPIPGAMYYVFLAITGLFLLAPYAVDRAIARRLPGLAGTLVFPLMCVAVGFFDSRNIYGTWGNVAYSQYGFLPLVQLVSVTGLFGISFLMAWFASLCNWAWEQELGSRAVRRGVILYGAVMLAVLLWGGTRLVVSAPSAATVRSASLSRADIAAPPDQTWRHVLARNASPQEAVAMRQWFGEVDDDLLARADREAAAGAKIIFWGETNALSYKEDEVALVERGRALARARQIYLAMAIGSFDPTKPRPLENKVVMIEPNGEIAWEYSKAHPVPGSESAMQLPSDGRLKAIDTPFGRLSSVICFDADFPHLLAQAGRLKADIVLDPSNDWQAIDPWHTQMATFRAVEQGVNLVRHTSHGLSLAVDYQGRVLGAMDHFAARDHDFVVQVPTRGVRTVYARIGDLFAWICVAGLVVLGVLALRRSEADRNRGR